MSEESEIEIPIDCERLAVFFFWTCQWFWLLARGRKYARRQADAMRYVMKPDGLEVEKGLWLKQNIFIPWRRVTSVWLYRNPLFNLSQIAIVVVCGMSWSCRAVIWAPEDPEGLHREIESRVAAANRR